MSAAEGGPSAASSLAAWDLGPAEAAVRARLDPGALAAVAALGLVHEDRHRAAWRAELLPPSSRDAADRALWSALLGPRLDAAALGALRGRLAAPVRSAFRALGRGLGLPAAVIEDRAGLAVEALDGAGLGAHLEIAARAVEAGGPPVRRLADALGEGAWRDVRAAVPQHRAWVEAVGIVGGLQDAGQLVRAVDVLCLLRAAAHRVDVEPDPHELPGWRALQANHDRVRGRLRAVLSRHPGELAGALLRAPSLAARLDAGARRWAWAWAWREARVGFSFDPERMGAPPCAPREEGPAALAPIGPDEVPVVRAWLACMLGRGLWPELEAWIEGRGGRALGSTFYRHLALLPDRLLDPGDGGRRYERVRAHLADGGIAAYVDGLRALATRARGIAPGRDLRARVQAVLGEGWATDEVPLPEHHLQGFVERLGGFLGG